MSGKRKAIKDLNHENWDQDDSPTEEEVETMGAFKTAPKEVMEKRVIRTAKRRAPISTDENKKSVFSGFGGFNKTQPSSFDFLANLTNGKSGDQAKSENGSSNLFSNKPFASNTISNTFTIPAVTSTSSKSPFVTLTTQSSIFGGTSAGTSLSPFSSKLNSPVVSTSAPNTLNTNSVTSHSKTPMFQTTPSIFGTSATSSKTEPLFSSSSSAGNSASDNKPKVNTASTLQTNFGSSSKSSDLNEKDNKSEDKSDDKKLNYYAKLQGLNESVSEWIKKHVDESPLCILTPIFKDYERYLKEIQDEYHSHLESSKNSQSEKSSGDKNISDNSNKKPNSSVLGTQDSTGSKSTSIFSTQNNTTNAFASNAKTSSPGFSFGINTSATATTNTTSLFSNTTNVSSPSTNGNAPFSFGIGKPFSFNSKIEKPSESTPAENEEDDEPPKVECTPIVEENSVFEKRCKVFVKKDGNFVDKGVGNLYIKKIEESGKHQLLVRANTNLGNVLLNMILSSNIPTQRMGKNNVMLVCIPNPDAKPPPTPVLIRVKTSEEADEVLETLNKFKS